MEISSLCRRWLEFADSMIVIAAGLLMLLIYRDEKAQGKHDKNDESINVQELDVKLSELVHQADIDNK